MSKVTQKFVPWLDVDEDSTFTANDWTPVDLSKIFELAMNPQTESVEYICNESAKTEVKSNAPSMDQEIAIRKDNPMYDFLMDKFFDCPTGTECEVPFLQTFDFDSYGKAWRSIATLILGAINTVDEVITFTIDIGDVTKGTFSLDSTTHKPTFTPASSTP